MPEAIHPRPQPSSPTASPPASVIIVNYNGRDLLARCLPEVLAQAEVLAAEVIVVDNGSTDGSAELIACDFPQVRCIRTSQNLGFAEGCNVGVRAAQADRVVLLNNDAVPEPAWLVMLLAALEPPDVAVACSVVHDRNFPEPYALGTGSLSVIGHPVANAMVREDCPFYATGASLAFKRAICGEPFDRLYFAYYEDVLLSWRVRLRGYAVARALRSHVQHLGSATSSRNPVRAFTYRERNKLLTLLLCFEASTLVRLLPLYLFDAVVRLLEDLWRAMTGRPPAQAGSPPLRHKYAALLRALWWLLTHHREIAARRAVIQRSRRVADRAITSMLSARIFDDVVPTRAHTIANRLSSLYCRLVGIPTVERARPA